MDKDQIEIVASVCHEANRGWCNAIGDHSQPTWEDAPQWQKDSAIMGVKFHIENPGAGPSGSHESWMKQKVADGWVYGPVKDAEAKTHHCMVPYGDLPSDQRMKDHLFVAIVRAFEEFM